MIEENEISYDDNEISKIKTDDVTRKQHNDVTRIKPQDVTRTQTDVMVQFQPDNAKPLQPDNVKPVQPDDVTRITDFANVKFSGLPRRRNRPTQEANSKPDKVKNSDEILISNSPLKIKPELLTATPYNQKIVKDEIKHLTKVITTMPQQQQPQSVTYSNNNNPFQSFFSNFYADKIRSSPRALTYEPPALTRSEPILRGLYFRCMLPAATGKPLNSPKLTLGPMASFIRRSPLIKPPKCHTITFLVRIWCFEPNLPKYEVTVARNNSEDTVHVWNSRECSDNVAKK